MPEASVHGDPTFWDEFFADRARPIPFFVEWPDENLAEWCEVGLTAPGRVLELGCGPGRNALYLAGLGASVDAVDFSAEAIEWARERAESAVTRALRPGGSYGLVCFTPEGGSGLTDQQAEEQDTVGGGLGFAREQLLDQWDRAPFAVRVLRPMRHCPESERRFGLDILWTLLAVKDSSV